MSYSEETKQRAQPLPYFKNYGPAAVSDKKSYLSFDEPMLGKHVSEMGRPNTSIRSKEKSATAGALILKDEELRASKSVAYNDEDRIDSTSDRNIELDRLFLNQSSACNSEQEESKKS